MPIAPHQCHGHHLCSKLFHLRSASEFTCACSLSAPNFMREWRVGFICYSSKYLRLLCSSDLARLFEICITFVCISLAHSSPRSRSTTLQLNYERNTRFPSPTPFSATPNDPDLGVHSNIIIISVYRVRLGLGYYRLPSSCSTVASCSLCLVQKLGNEPERRN